MNERLAIGVVTGTHGVAGELKVKSFSGEWDHLMKLREAVFTCKGVEKQVSFQSVRPQPPGIIIKISGVETPEQARRFVGCEIWVPRAQAAPLGRGEYYEADLCNCAVLYDGREIGKVSSVWDVGLSQLLEVRMAEGTTFLVPFNAHYIGDVEVEKGRIYLTGDELVP